MIIIKKIRGSAAETPPRKFCFASARSTHSYRGDRAIKSRDATRCERTAADPITSRSARAEDEDGGDREWVYLREAESVFSASPPRASERLPRAAAAGQRVPSVQPIRSPRPRSISITQEQSRRCSGASCHMVSFSAAARDYQSNAGFLQLMILDH